MPALYFPAEWTEQSAVLLTWPHGNTDWKKNLDEVSAVYVKIAAEILQRESLIIICNSAHHAKKIEYDILYYADQNSYQKTNSNLHFYPILSNDTWTRDHGPITIIQNKKPKLLNFIFNGWGNKFDHFLDNQISAELFKQNAFSQETDFENINMILEGGAIETDGAGSLLTTKKCLLNPNRNLGWPKNLIEKTLRSFLGISQILWLDEGHLAGDDTDGHIDTLARFCPDNKICYVQSKDKKEEHYLSFSRMEKQLQSFKNTKGIPYQLFPLPMPQAIYQHGERLPATYANFLIINGAVLLPIYGVNEDDLAIQQIQRCFPQHNIIPINCLELIKQHGSLHCITMQLPKGVII